MKRHYIFLIALLLLTSFTYGQNVEEYKAFIKERHAIQKLTKEERNEKISKDVRKRAKGFKKEGWKVTMGALSLEKQLERSEQLQYEYDLESGMPKYVHAEGKSTSDSYDAAKMQAMANAKTILAGNIQTEVAAIIETKVGNEENVASINDALAVSKQIIAQKLQRVLTIVECYREKSGKYEVLVMIFYNGDIAVKAAKEAVKDELKKKGDKLAEELDNMLGF